MEKNAQEKREVISKLLANTVYLPGSGLRLNVERALWRMSISDLHNLELIVSIRVRDAELNQQQAAK